MWFGERQWFSEDVIGGLRLSQSFNLRDVTGNDRCYRALYELC